MSKKELLCLLLLLLPPRADTPILPPLLPLLKQR
jgi:hypothetical protein